MPKSTAGARRPRVPHFEARGAPAPPTRPSPPLDIQRLMAITAKHHVELL
ncbi:MAG: hypothetical protein ACLP8S_11260 [Solirubrobacteraceae bacterium]